MTVLRKITIGVLGAITLGVCSPAVAQASSAQQPLQKNGDIEFRVGASTSNVIRGARIIVINHDGNIVGTGLTDSSGVWHTSVPYYNVTWNKKFEMKGIVNVIVIANGYNEQAVFLVPITEHTIQPVVLQPIKPNRRNEPSESLGDIHHQDLQKYVARYAGELGLKKQSPIAGDFGYAPWSPEGTNRGDAAK